MKIPVTVIVITHDRLEHTKTMVEFLFDTMPSAEFIIYDNHSTEWEMNEWLRSLEFVNHKVKVILANDTIDWDKAVDYALTHAKTTNILISNLNRPVV